MEELHLTDPVVVPETVTTKYRVVALTLNLEAQVSPDGPGQILIELRDNLAAKSSYSYVGPEAMSLIKFLNTANLSTKSMHKRILEKLAADGLLPGTVVGAPDP